MPSARELLEQADALMRKNRSRGDADIPVLTDAVVIAPVASPLLVQPVIAVEERAAGPSVASPSVGVSDDAAAAGKPRSAIRSLKVQRPESPSSETRIDAAPTGKAATTAPQSEAAAPSEARSSGPAPIREASDGAAPGDEPLTRESSSAAARSEQAPTMQASSDPTPITRASTMSAEAVSTTSIEAAPKSGVPAGATPTMGEAALPDTLDGRRAAAQPTRDPPSSHRGTMEGDPSDWLVMDTIDPMMHGTDAHASDTPSAAPPMTLKAAGSAATPPPVGSQARDKEIDEQGAPGAVGANVPSAVEGVSKAASRSTDEQNAAVPMCPVDDGASMATTQVHRDIGTEASLQSPGQNVRVATRESAGGKDQELWRALAEQISMQVLQRLDLFTDAGLKAQLTQRLEPIVQRASAELVGEIGEQVGRLVRTYVSEAIEREIAQWKRDQH